MANLPSNRTKLNEAVANQQASIIASSQANREALIEIYDTADLLNQKVDGYVGSGSLSPYLTNFIINGNFSINQRVVSGTVILTAGQYGHDRWKSGTGGCTYTFSTANNVTTITIVSGSLVQVIEGVNLYSGTHTLSWGGTAQGKIGAGTYSTSGVKATVTGGTNLSIEFNAGTLSKVQFNIGESALPFQPRGFAEELVLCQRYYFKTFSYGTMPKQNAGLSGAFVVLSQANSSFGGVLRFPIPMRFPPSVMTYNPAAANANWRETSSSTDKVVSMDRINEKQVVLFGSLGNIGTENIIHVSADAEL